MMIYPYDHVEFGEFPMEEPIHRATQAGDIGAVERMLLRGDSPNVSACDWWATKPLHIAILNNRADMVSLLLRHGADSESLYREYRPNSTPLTLAMELGLAGVVRALVLGGADPNAPNDEGNHPLSVAIGMKNEDVLSALLEAPRINPDAPDEGGIPGLFRFLAAQEFEAAARLLELGADPNAAAPSSGNTPLHEAARRNLTSMVELLLLYGANPEARNLRGEPPCALTTHPHTLNLLRAASARHPRC